MKKKTKKLIQRFFKKTDKTEYADYPTLQDQINDLIQRIDTIEDQQLLLLREFAKYQSEKEGG